MKTNMIKKLISSTLCLAMLCALIPAGVVLADAEPTIYFANGFDTYADGTTATVDQDDPNLVFKYDTSVPGENHTGVVEIGNKKANFTFTVKDAEFETDPIDRAGEKVTLLAPKFPTSLIVTFICAGVVILLVAAWAVLKFVFKVDFKRKKRVSLDDIF